MKKVTNPQTPDFWIRTFWIWAAIYYLTLLVPTGMVLLAGDADVARIIPVAIAAAVWHVGATIYILRQPGRRAGTPFTLFFLAGVLVFWFWLINLNDVYYFMLFSLFSQMYANLRIRLAIAGSGIVMILMFASQKPGDALYPALANGNFWIFLLSTLFANIFALWIHGIIRQSMGRRELIDELQATQAELAATEHQRGILAERQRLAREIHDTLAQGFSSIVMHLEAAEQAMADDTPALQRHLDQARQTARDSLAQARHVVQDLRPDLLEREPFDQALAQVVRRWSGESGVAARFTSSGTARSLHPQVEVTLLRVLQEATANIRKHAQADSVSVTLTYFEDLVVLDVQDNGLGLEATPPPASLTGGFGLQAMGERVAALEGRLLVESEAGAGTTIVVEIPITDAHPATETQSPKPERGDR